MGLGFASAMTSYYETMRRHIDGKENKLLKEINLILISKAGIEDEEEEKIFRIINMDNYITLI